MTDKSLHQLIRGQECTQIGLAIQSDNFSLSLSRRRVLLELFAKNEFVKYSMGPDITGVPEVTSSPGV